MARLLCGILRLDGHPADTRQVLAMLHAMQPKGRPCAHSVACDGAVALGILEIGNDARHPPVAPLIVPTINGFCAVDARLYDVSGEHPDPDARLANLVEHEGPCRLAELHGDFAFAHWHRARGLLLARDHFGTRPIQYTVKPGLHAAFASLPAGLLRTGLASRMLDQACIAGYPINEQPLPGRTYFRDIRSVQAAHTVALDARGNCRERRYWRLPLEPLLPFDTDPQDASAEILRLLDQAVRRRLPSTGSVAAHMSGGLDSTPIAILAARAVRDQGRECLAYSFQEQRGVDHHAPIIDEAPYVSEAAASEPNLRVEPIHTASSLDTVLQGIDPETLLPQAKDDPENAVLHHAAGHGVQVLLSGWGGDQVVSSYGTGWDGDLLRAGHFRALLRGLKAHSRAKARPLHRTLASFAISQLPARLMLPYRRLRNAFPWLEYRKFIAPRKRGIARHEYRLRHAHSRACRRAELEAWWIPYRLEMFFQLGAPHGVSYAYPMLDRDLIRYAMRLPGSLYRSEGTTRRLIRDALMGVVPERVRLREEKFVPFPNEALRVARQRDAILQRVEELGRIPLVSDYLDIAAILDYLRCGSSEADILRQMDTAAAAGEQFETAPEEEHASSLRLALFLAAQASSGQTHS